MENVDKGLRFHLKIRVYGQSLDTSKSHSYCVDDCPAGVSPPVGTLYVDILSVTLRQMRQMIQFNKTGHMDKRSLMFQEAIFIMQRLPNLYSRPKAELLMFQYGFYNRETRKTKFVDPNDESMPLGNLIGAASLQVHDVVIVPLSQLPVESMNPGQYFVPELQQEVGETAKAEIAAAEADNEKLLN